MNNYDFSGWATKANMLCSDGRTIMKDAFKDDDGKKVPLVYGHLHKDPNAVLGHALLENREEGVYCYCSFNDTESGRTAKEFVKHGDVSSLSIYANKLKHNGGNVIHGAIKEVSLVLAGANPGAFIDSVIIHGEESDEDALIYNDEMIVLNHEEKEEEEDPKMDPASTEAKKEDEETVEDIFNTLNEKQQDAVYYVMGELLKNKTDKEEGDDEEMKHNIFDAEENNKEGVLTHEDQMAIINLAKNSRTSLQNAIEDYSAQNESLAHGFDSIETLFPDYKDVYPGAPEKIQRDLGWVGTVMSKVHKSPISRIRTRQADITGADFRAFGYKKGKMKQETGNIKLLKRTTDPQTVYRKDSMHRDDMIDITDFDVVEYQYGIMKDNLNEELAMAIMIGDGRDDGDEMKISEEHIRSIWNDDELYTIHADVDFATAATALQGSGTGVSFGENYIYAEEIITKALYAREKYKGSGNLDFYCTPHLVNVMLLARDMNGRRIYDSKADLTAALNVGNIYTCEQFEDKTRTTSDNKTKKLLGIFVNLSDYQVGSTKGGEITRFNQFDIDFNQEKYLIETRLSGALTRVKSAIALEEDVTDND